IYYYAKTIPWTPLEPAERLGNLVVKYLEQGTNKELAPDVTGKEKVGTDYTTKAEVIDGYTLVSTPSNTTGQYIDGTVEVIYYYAKTIPWTPLEPAERLGNLVVKYLEQ
ncbi:MucBP domain-containing protein, partial [Clostridium perfringens]